jgi:hypothetical protein
LKRSLFALLPPILALGSLAYGKDKSDTYQLGTYVTSVAVSDGTTSDNIRCGDGSLGTTVCSGGVQANGVTVYQIQVDGGVWYVETDRQVADSMARRVFNSEPVHFKGEGLNPLDLLKAGDKVLFRIETHKKIGGTETDIYIPFASNPDKEAKFVGAFHPAVVPAAPARPSDNVRAMCDAHKLSPELEKQLCPVPAPTTDTGIQQIATNSEAAKGSPAAAAALASAGHVLSQQELADLVQKGQASRCAVVTVPPGAEVYVDGNKTGLSPLAFVLLKLGDTPRKVTIKMTGYKTVEKAVVPDGKTIPIGLTLERQ